MKRFVLFGGLLCAVAFPCYAQNWMTQDSLRLQQLLKGEGEVKLNPDILKEIDMGSPFGTPKAAVNKPWMDFDDTLPVSLPGEPKKTIKLSLRPYSANTKYDWDPIYQKKIEIKKDTWRGEPFRELTTRFIYTNWAKTPSDPGSCETVEQIEATGLRYRVMERVNNMAVGSWQGAGGGGIGGLELMTLFTREFWSFKGRKRRARTLEVLRTYGDSITVKRKPPTSK